MRTSPFEVPTRATVGLWGWFFLCFCCAHSVAAQHRPILFDNLSLEDGLAQSTVTAVVQDRYGFIWLGTEGGLHLYHCYRFLLFKNNLEDPSSLSHSHVNALFVDTDGILWIGTYGGGLNRFDYASGTFERIRLDPALEGSARIQALLGDDDHRLWIGTDRGLYRLDADRDQARLVLPATSPDSALAVHALAPADSNRLWLGTERNGLFLFDPGEQDTLPWQQAPALSNPLETYRIDSIQSTADGMVWIGTEGGGLYRLDSSSGALRSFRHDPADPASLCHDAIQTLLPSREAYLWVGTLGGGLCRYRAEKDTFERFLPDPATPNGLSDSEIRTLFEDRSGLLWVGTWGRGVDRARRSPFTLYRHNPTDANSLGDSDVMSFAEDDKGRLWIGSYQHGLSRLDLDTGRFTRYHHVPGTSGTLSHDAARRLYVDRTNTLWVGTFGGGLNRYHGPSDTFSTYRQAPDDPFSLASDHVTAFLETTGGDFWVGTFGGGPCRLDRRTDQFDCLARSGVSLGSLNTYALHEDERGRLWISGWGSGLDVYDPETGALQHYRYNPDDPRSLSNNSITSFFQDRAGRLWIATYGGGLNRFDETTGGFHHLTEHNGLPNDIVYGILEDAAGRLWISTNGGLARLNPETGTITPFDAHDGLQSNEFNGGAYLALSSGLFAFGGIHGFNLFHPDSVRASTFAPPVVLTSFQTFNTEKHFDEPLSALQAAQLSHRENFLAFEFAVLDFALPSRNRYAYKLEGIDQDWIDSRGRRYAAYPNLAPGSYVLRVRGANHDGRWSEHELALPITIIPPFWMTGWFRGLLILFVLTLLVGVVRYVSTRRLRARLRRLETDRKLQAERERISRDLHDHVGAQLSAIISTSELIRLSARSGDAERLQAHLAALNEDTRLTMAQLRETIWTLDPEAVTTEAFMVQIDQYARRLTRHAPTPRLHIHLEGNPAHPLTPAQALNLYRIAQESITNTLKHAAARNLSVTLHAPDEGPLTLEIQDDGHPKTSTPSGGGRGLANMQRRTEELGGRLEIAQDPQHGTRVAVTVPG